MEIRKIFKERDILYYVPFGRRLLSVSVLLGDRFVPEGKRRFVFDRTFPFPRNA
jgi:hypothetical protein